MAGLCPGRQNSLALRSSLLLLLLHRLAGQGVTRQACAHSIVDVSAGRTDVLHTDIPVHCIFVPVCCTLCVFNK